MKQEEIERVFLVKKLPSDLDWSVIINNEYDKY